MTLGAALLALGWFALPWESDSAAPAAAPQTADAAAATPRFGTTRAAHNPWDLAAEATRQADATQKPAQADCGLPVVADPALSEEERDRRVTQYSEERIRQVARQLLNAPDELGPLTGALLMEDLSTAVRIAQGTRDPVVYGLALRHCSRSVATPACKTLSPQQWAQLDPSNAAAWWAVAAASRDQTSATAAMQRAANAPGLVSLNGQMLKRAAALPGMSPEAILPILSVTLGIDSVDSLLGSQGLSAACGRAPQDAPDRRALCEGLALSTLRQQPSVLGRLVLTRKAEQLGVHADRLPQSPAFLKQLARDIEAARSAGFEPGGVMGCDVVRRIVAFDLDTVEGGDIAAYARFQQRRAASSAAASAPTL